MIGLVNIRASRRVAGCGELCDLPPAPALRWSAFLIRTTRDLDLVEVVPWAGKVRSRRAFIPIGLVRDLDPGEAALLEALADTGMGFDPIVDPGDLTAGVVTEEQVARLRDGAVEGIILRLWRRQWKAHDRSLLPLLCVIAGHGIRGGLAYSLRATGPDGALLSESTVRRRLRKAGLPTLGRLLRDARIRGVQLRTQLGADKGDALMAAGFSSVKAFENAKRRLG